jgi:hypothetical protein
MRHTSMAARAGTDGSGLFDCVLCCEQRSTEVLWPCGHTQVCLECALRMRVLFHDFNCPFCKALADDVIVVGPMSNAERLARGTSRPRSYADAGVTKGSCVADEASKMTFSDPSVQRQALLFTGLRCPMCVVREVTPARERAAADKGLPPIAEALARAPPFPSIADLKRHAASAHAGRLFCDVCLAQRKVFSYEQRLYLPKTLPRHVEQGDPPEGDFAAIPPHPYCSLCDSSFLSIDEVFAHLEQHHALCRICSRFQDGPENRRVYAKSAAHLIAHNRTNHFACMHEECVADPAAAFATEVALETHALLEHTSGILSRGEVALDLAAASESTGRDRRPGGGPDVLILAGHSGRIILAKRGKVDQALHQAGLTPDTESAETASATGAAQADEMTIAQALARAKAAASAIFDEQVGPSGPVGRPGSWVKAMNDALQERLTAFCAQAVAAGKAEPGETDKEVYARVLAWSAKFRTSTLSASEYHRLLHELLGDDAEATLLPLLASLLPDPSLRANLRAIFVSIRQLRAARAFHAKDLVLLSNLCAAEDTPVVVHPSEHLAEGTPALPSTSSLASATASATAPTVVLTPEQVSSFARTFARLTIAGEALNKVLLPLHVDTRVNHDQLKLWPKERAWIVSTAREIAKAPRGWETMLNPALLREVGLSPAAVGSLSILIQHGSVALRVESAKRPSRPKARRGRKRGKAAGATDGGDEGVDEVLGLAELEALDLVIGLAWCESAASVISGVVGAAACEVALSTAQEEAAVQEALHSSAQVAERSSSSAPQRKPKEETSDKRALSARSEKPPKAVESGSGKSRPANSGSPPVVDGRPAVARSKVSKMKGSSRPPGLDSGVPPRSPAPAPAPVPDPGPAARPSGPPPGLGLQARPRGRGAPPGFPSLSSTRPGSTGSNRRAESGGMLGARPADRSVPAVVGLTSRDEASGLLGTGGTSGGRKGKRRKDRGREGGEPDGVPLA